MTDPLSDEAYYSWAVLNKCQGCLPTWQESARRALIETDGLEARIKSDAEEIKRLRELLKSLEAIATLASTAEWLDQKYVWTQIRAARAALEGKE